MKCNKGFTLLVLILIIIGVLFVSGGVYYLIKNTGKISTPIESNIHGINGKMFINGKEIILPKQECDISSTQGGSIDYILSVSFIDENKDKFNNVKFSVQDSKNKERNLLKVGIHSSTGQHWDNYSNYLQPHTYTWRMKPNDMDIVLTNIEIDKDVNSKFSAEGYVNIKKLVKIDFIENEYIEPQQIYFKCNNYSHFDYNVNKE